MPALRRRTKEHLVMTGKEMSKRKINHILLEVNEVKYNPEIFILNCTVYYKVHYKYFLKLIWNHECNISIQLTAKWNTRLFHLKFN